MTTSIQLLQAAKERLFTTGWQQRSFGPQEGPNCLLGALNHVGMNSTLECFNGNCALCEAENALTDILNVSSIVIFNDDGETTFSDVVDVIDLAIKNLEGL